MKTILKVFITVAFLLTLSCAELNKTLETVNSVVNSTSGVPALTNDEVISGLKEALTLGIKNSAGIASANDGFYKNNLIKIPFPEEAIKLKERMEEIGFTSQVNKFEETLNRAAEEASKKSVPIFIDAIGGMSISDGFSILKGDKNAATQFLKTRTTAKLSEAFKPDVQEAIKQVQLTKYWAPLADKYNIYATLTGKEKVNPDLDTYVTERAIDGLFKLVEIEEAKIREDPAARVTDILKKVFGS